MRQVLLAALLLLSVSSSSAHSLALSAEVVVFQTSFGDIRFRFIPEAAPVTVQHIFKLVVLGCYQSNHFFRVDKGFVAQTADVVGGRTLPMNDEQKAEAEKNVPLEVREDVKHLKGVLSMGRLDAPDSGHSSFSMLLGDYKHLDMQYTIFGQIIEGMETLAKMEEAPTHKEGIFIMPKERINIHATYWYIEPSKIQIPFCQGVQCSEGASEDGHALAECRHHVETINAELQKVRHKCLP